MKIASEIYRKIARANERYLRPQTKNFNQICMPLNNENGTSSWHGVAVNHDFNYVLELFASIIYVHNCRAKDLLRRIL
jgi:hypothetical protein